MGAPHGMEQPLTAPGARGLRLRAFRAKRRPQSVGATRLRFDDARCLRLTARGSVAVHRAAGGCAVEPADELTVLGGDAVLVAVLHRSLETLGERLGRRAVVQVLEPL